MTWIAPVGIVLLAYLVGSIPASYIAGRLARGIDLRDHGSGNLGATNVVRVLGWAWAIPTAFFDIAKGFAPAWFATSLLGIAGVESGGGTPEAWTLAIGLAAVLGHVFSIWVGFRGGKGIATALGVFLALSPLGVGGAALVWVALVLTTRYVSAGSISAVVSLPFFVYWAEGGFDPATGAPGLIGPLGLAVLVAVLGTWAHRANIGRLLNGTENRFSKRKAT